MHTGLGVDQQSDMGRGRVGHQHRHGERADSPDALLALYIPLIQCGDQAADTGADRDTQPFGIDLVVLAEAESGIGPGFAGRDQRKLADTVHPAGVDARDPLRKIRIHLTGDLHGQVIGPVGLDTTDAAASGKKCLPGRRCIVAKRGNGTESCDDDIGH